MNLRSSMAKTVIFLLPVSFICSCDFEKDAIDKINGKYYTLLPKGKNEFSVEVRVKGLERPHAIYSQWAQQEGNNTLAEQFLDLHAKLFYTKSNDSVNIEYSPLDIERSIYLARFDKVKSGYQDMVSGALQYMKPLLVEKLIVTNNLKPLISMEDDQFIVSFKTPNESVSFVFDKDFKEVDISGSSKMIQSSEKMVAHEMGDKLVFSYQESTINDETTYMYLTYVMLDGHLVPSEIRLKYHAGFELTFVFSNWEFK